MYRYDFGYAYGSGALAAIGIFLLALVIYVLVSFITRWNMFIKAGERGWKSLIPVYSEYTEWKIAGFGKEYWITLILYAALALTSLLLCLIDYRVGSIISAIFWAIGIAFVIIISIRKCMRLAGAFGQSDLFGLLVLLLFPTIGLLILSWGNCRYTAPAPRLGPDGRPLTGLKGTMLFTLFSDIRNGRIIDQ